ncbi:hydrogenase 4 subunit B [Candidatus Azambacteria bacterium]|nr:hydrogenase 4 subunit B [Candidatus Azambacteria bacterium]MBI3684790.1 hydrogenase 4 subunit B [Candidatus Azambacteria bacterium]
MGILFFATLFLFLLGALSGFVFWRTPHIAKIAAHTIAMCASLTGILFALSVFASHQTFQFSSWHLFSIASVVFSVDALSAFFILLVCGTGFVVSLYAVEYVSQYEKTYPMGLLGFLYNTFICSMVLVVAADNMIVFLAAWELMSVVSYFLVTYEYKKESSLRAGFLYAVMTHFGTALLVIAFLLLFRETGSFQFSDFRLQSGGMFPWLQNLIFILAFIGFSTKAGVVPHHIWLPEAHPAAPTHISALMSGTMIKIAIYGIVRFAFDLLGAHTVWWWGVLVLAVGVVSAIMGVLYALMEHNLKRLLAYHSVENIGIILIGIGSALLFQAFGLYTFVGLGLIAALYHVLNHSIFKTLLFLGAGSVQKIMRSNDMERMGGLARYMPFTAVFFLIGAMAISGLPPLNGFVSEWLVFQGLFYNLMIDSIAVKIGVSISVALLALTGALALACFAKVYGIVFCALPRSKEASEAHEAGKPMVVSMAFLACACVALGVIPGIGFSLFMPIVEGLHLGHPIVSSWFSIMPAQSFPTRISPFTVIALVGGIIATGMLLMFMIWGRHRKRSAPTWACGRVVESKMEYTASSFAMPFKLIFSGLYRPTHNIERETLKGSQYLVTAVRYEEKIEPLFERYLYEPFINAMIALGNSMRKIQGGNINVYLSYIFIALLVLLFVFV